MSMRFKGGIISATPPTTTGGESGTASGAWTLQQQMQAQAAGNWPVPQFLSGPAFLWGTNEKGQLGRNVSTTYFVSSPVQLGSDNWSSSASGENFFIATKGDGTLWSWGKNDSGELALGYNNVPRSSPTQIGALTNWSSYNVANNNIAGTLKSTALWVWGNGGYGALGINSINNESSPVQVSGSWLKVSAGNRMFLAIKTSGTLWAWGLNSSGCLGLNTYGSYTEKSSPTQIGALNTWIEVSVTASSCAAIKTDGTLWTWGDNYQGKLGQGNTVSRSSPVQVGSDTNWSKVLVINESMIALKTNGTMWSWGLNHKGQLGLNLPTSGYSKSSPTQIGALTSWTKIGGVVQSVFAIKNDGTLWAWGRNDWGQLGQNNNIFRSSPVQIGSLTTWKKIQNGGSGNSPMILKI